MKKGTLIAVILLSAAALAARDHVAVTIYNQNRALVREIRSMNIVKGTGILSFKDVASRIDPTSVYFISQTSPDKLTVIEQNYEYDLVNSDKILNKYIDKNITLVSKDGDVFKGILLSRGGGNIVLSTNRGIKIIRQDVLERYDLPELPSGLITKPTLVWQVNNLGPVNQDVEVSYLTGGMTWHAEYIAVVSNDDKKLSLNGWVSIKNSSGTAFSNAKIKLVAGDVNVAKKTNPAPRSEAGALYMAKQAPQFEEKSFFEYHLYTLNRPATLKNNQIKQITLFPAAKVDTKKVYTFDSVKSGNKVAVKLVFKNKKSSGLGLPLPKGKIRVYKQDEDGAQEFIGEDYIDHTPKGEEINVLLGNAFDITGKRKSVSQKKISKRVREETYEISLRNHKDVPVQIVVLEHLWGDWKIMKSSHPYTKKDVSTIKFVVTVKPESSETVSYTSRLSW
ncbi:DUF4139 domain-containing protein [bacterium]|nr:DUF4139 domain-containing protein [bacterium]